MAFALPASAQTAGGASTSTLREVQVEATADSFKADRVSSPKFSEPLVDTPQTITVIKKEVLQEQGAATLTEALRNTPGVTFQMGENGNTSTGDAVFLRGFDTSGSVFIDGARDIGTVTRDMFNVESVEVVKGPASADIGRTAPTGYINLVSKVPLAENFFAGSVGIGSGDYKRVTGDFNRVLNESGSMAFRLNVMKQDSGVVGRDYVENKGWGVAPSIAFGLNTPTRVILQYQHIDQKNRPDGGLPTIGLDGFYLSQLAARAATGRASTPATTTATCRTTTTSRPTCSPRASIMTSATASACATSRAGARPTRTSCSPASSATARSRPTSSTR